MAPVCDSCSMAFADEGADEEMLEVTAVLELGADIPDHCCDRTETDGEVECDCPCSRR